MDNVHRLEVKPKLTHHMYKRHDITVTYIPSEDEWKWSFELRPKTVSFGGRAPSADAALKHAKAQIDDIG